MSASEITVSNLSIVDPYFALLNGIRTRQESLKREWAYCSQSTKRDIAKPNFVRKCIAALAELHQMEGRLDIPSPITQALPHGEHFPEEGPEAIRLIDHVSSAKQSAVRKAFRALGTATEQKQDIFGLEGKERYNKPTWWLQDVMTELKSKGAAGRLAEHRWRMIEEIEHRTSQGWYVVFNTLTVDNTNYKSVFAKGSTAWRYYVREIDRAVGTSLYGTTGAAEAEKKNNPFHSYFAVVERGGSTGRLHIHVIHCLRELPEDWKRDPNRSNGPPVRRQITAMKKFWKYGHSMPIGVRFSGSDAFSRLGWCWPVKRAGDKFIPTDVKPPIAIARYVCKYIMKSYSTGDTDRWRTRISAGFGLTRMRETIEAIDRSILWKFLGESPIAISVNDANLPGHRLRLECLRSLLRPMRNGVPESASSLSLLRTIRRSLKEVVPRQPIAERLRSLTRPMKGYSSPSSTTCEVNPLIVTGASDVRTAFRSAFERPVIRFASHGGSPRH